MTTISAPPVRQQMTRPDMASAVEAILRRIKRTSTELLQSINESDPCEANATRSEIQRLSGVGFDLTRLLCAGDVKGAYQIITGDASESGDVLGTIP